MLPYLSSAAIDLKAVPELTGRVMGISEERGKKMHKLSLETQKIISQAGVLLDVRTPIFGDTTTEQMARLAESICRENNLDYTFWTWRLYKPVEGCDFVVPKKENTIKMLVEISKRFPELWIGIRAKWEKGGMLYFRGGEMVSATSEVTNQDLYEIAYGEGVKMPD
jgi:pyruvate formate lyase activating enzyme